jgi:hypothetical protein
LYSFIKLNEINSSEEGWFSLNWKFYKNFCRKNFFFDEKPKNSKKFEKNQYIMGFSQEICPKWVKNRRNFVFLSKIWRAEFWKPLKSQGLCPRKIGRKSKKIGKNRGLSIFGQSFARPFFGLKKKWNNFQKKFKIRPEISYFYEFSEKIWKKILKKNFIKKNFKKIDFKVGLKFLWSIFEVKKTR